MRIRSTKPEFWRSRTVASVSWDARLVLKGLESYVDDNGVGKDDLELICGDLFPRDLAREGSRILARVSEAITELSQAGLIWRYEDEGAPLVYISCWESVQRVDKPQAGRFRRPDGTKNYRESLIRESVANPREPSRALAPGTGEQGNRGTGEQRGTALSNGSAVGPAPTPAPDDFADFWDAYPRKEGKRKAESAYRAAIRRATAARIIDGAARYRDDPNREQQYTAHASTWLNRDGWDDAPLPARGGRTTDRQGDILRAEMDRARRADGALDLYPQIGAST